MAESKPLKINPKGLKLLHENLEKIGQEMDMVVDDEPREIEAVDDNTEKTIKENVIDKTKRILRPEERKRFLAIGEIFMDEWLSQIRDYQANERKVGLLTGAISMLKKKIQNGVRTILNIFKWQKGEKKERKSASIVKLMAILAGIGITVVLFWDDLKKMLPKDITTALEKIATDIKDAAVAEFEKKYGTFDEICEKAKTKLVNSLNLDEIWVTYVELYLAFRRWSQNPWDEFLMWMGIEEVPIERRRAMHYSKKTIEEAKQILMNTPMTVMSGGIPTPTAWSDIPKREWAERILKDEEELTAWEEMQGEKEMLAEIKRKDQRIQDIKVSKNTANVVVWNNEGQKESKFFNKMFEKIGSLSATITPKTPSAEPGPDWDRYEAQAKDIVGYLSQIPPVLEKFFDNENVNGFKSLIDNHIKLVAENTIDTIVKVRKEKGLRWWIVPHADGPHQSEQEKTIHYRMGKGYHIGLPLEYKDHYDRSDYSVKRIYNYYTTKQIDKFHIIYQDYDGEKLEKLFREIESQDNAEIEELKKHNEYLGEILSSMEKAVSNLSLVGPEFESK